MSSFKLPVTLDKFVPYLAQSKSIHHDLQPYIQYEQELRKLYAQDCNNPVLDDPHVNAVPIFAGHEDSTKIRARDLSSESDEEKERYLLPLGTSDRKPSGTKAMVSTMKEFLANFNVFSESSLVDLDWSNIVVAGSAAVTSLIPVPERHNESKRALRNYYHELLAPASDVDIFLYGLDNDEAIKKINQIESRIRDSILQETTTIRTKNAITIASQYPTRHIQIVLRLYKSVSEILTGFDVDCSCVAFDGSQVYAAPRAIAAFMTQTNTIDLSRRSPSYENRLSKYAHRGFEVYWPALERARVDPTIFERSFSRVMGLARLLVLEKLPMPQDREQYMIQRRQERGRPLPPTNARFRELPGNIKDKDPNDVAEWVVEEDVSNYHTFTIPYGPKYHAKKIERLLFTKDLLLNAEWNKPKDRETNLHRHPAFFGNFDNVIQDCCGYCSAPSNEEDEALAEQESKIYVKGKIDFIRDDPGRQAIGSFNPITDDDWTEMAYVGNTTRLCQAIIDEDLEHVRDWCSQEGADVNRRDHTGRTPLQLAAACSNVDIVRCLIDNGARLVARMADGFTALHLAAQRGHLAIVTALLERSELNQAEEDSKQDQLRRQKRSGETNQTHGEAEQDPVEPETHIIDDDESLGSKDTDDMTQGSYVRVKPSDNATHAEEADTEGPDVYEIDTVAWDRPVSPLHLAIVQGHIAMVGLLIESFGADVMLPVKLRSPYSSEPDAAILTLVLAAKHSPEPTRMTQELLNHGASSSQADMHEITALHFLAHSENTGAIDMLLEYDRPAALAAINHFVISGYQWHPCASSPLYSAIRRRDSGLAIKLLDNGARPSISYKEFAKTFMRKFEHASGNTEQIQLQYHSAIEQPVCWAINNDLPAVALKLIEKGADVNTLNREASRLLWEFNRGSHVSRSASSKTLLDLVDARIRALTDALASKDEDLSFPIPEALDKEDDFLDGLDTNSYRFWMAKTDFALAKCLHGGMLATHRQSENLLNAHPDGSHEKRDAMKEAIEEFSNLMRHLRTSGAVSIQELHPDLVDDGNTVVHRKPLMIQDSNSIHHVYHGKYRPKLAFIVPGVEDAMAQCYPELFEAAWAGDMEQLKTMTLGPWALRNGRAYVVQKSASATDSRRPLHVAARDSRGFTPFSLAVARGHYELAKVIIDIATAQYQPQDGQARYRYTLKPSDEYDQDSVSESETADDVPVIAHLVGVEYTIQDVAALSNTVDSRVSPISMLGFSCELWRFLDDMPTARRTGLAAPEEQWHHVMLHDRSLPETSFSQAHMARIMDYTSPQSSYHPTSSDVPQTMISYAISCNDLAMFRFMLENHEQLMRSQEAPDQIGRRVTMPDGMFTHATRLGRTEMLGEMLKRTGAEIPLQMMAKETGIQVSEKPHYYQGLTVYGEKRRDWADRSRGVFQVKPIEIETPPLLRAAIENNVETTEYLYGEAPLRRYEEFIQAHREDGAVKALEQSPGGAKAVLTQWLGRSRHLAIHASAMARPLKHKDTSQLRFLLSHMPDAVNSRSSSGLTPLHVAFQCVRYSAARFLLENGADPLLHDKGWENILHRHLRGIKPDDISIVFPAFLRLLEPGVAAELLLKRSSSKKGARTPLFSMLEHIHRTYDQSYAREFLTAAKIVFLHTQGKDLEIMDGAGDYPLHYAVRLGNIPLARLFIEQNPKCLYLENAVGMIPLDAADAAVLALRLTEPDNSVRGDRYWPDNALPNMRSELFLPVEKQHDETFNVFKCRALLQEEMEKAPGRRKLVRLDDANEVAKRLAHRQSQRQRHDEHDEVDNWAQKASQFENYDVRRLHGWTLEADLNGNE